VITDLVNPNGLAFSPDEKKLYVVEWKGTPNRSIWSYDVAADGASVSNKTKLIDAGGPVRARRLPRRPRRQPVVRLGPTAHWRPEPTDIGGGMKAYLPTESPKRWTA
jgi:gluconolactonase